MCTVSMVAQDWNRRYPPPAYPYVFPTPYVHPATPPVEGPTQQDFDALRKEVEELKKLLVAAKEYDDKTGQPDCEMEEKVALIKKFAKFVGVDLSDVWGEEEK